MKISYYFRQTQDPPPDDSYESIIFIVDKTKLEGVCPCCLLYEEYDLADENYKRRLAEDIAQRERSSNAGEGLEEIIHNMKMKSCCRRNLQPSLENIKENCIRIIKEYSETSGDEQLVKNVITDNKTKENVQVYIQYSSNNIDKHVTTAPKFSSGDNVDDLKENQPQSGSKLKMTQFCKAAMKKLFVQKSSNTIQESSSTR